MGKQFLAVLLIGILGTANSFACEAFEAQFIGTVTGVQRKTFNSKLVACEIQVKNFRFFQEHQLCPLDHADASRLWLKDDTCSIKFGDEVSGVMSVKTDGSVDW